MHLTFPYDGKLLFSGTSTSTNTKTPENLFWNPAGMGKNSYLASVFNYSGLIFGSLGKIWEFNSVNFGLGVQLMRSETMVKTSATGTSIGTFNYQSTVPLIAANVEIDQFTIGGKILLPYTTVDEYKSYGLGTDIGAIYSLNDLFSFSAYLRNFGWELKSFLSEKEKFPMDIRLGELLKNDKIALSLEYSSLFGPCFSISYNFNKIIGLTVGYNSRIGNFSGIKTSKLAGFSFGLNIKHGKINIAVGTVMSGPEGISETISISFIP